MHTQTYDKKSSPNLIGGEFTITPTRWTVTLGLDSNSRNPQHTFIIIEGMNNKGETILKLADLVMSDEKASASSAPSGKAEIRLIDLNIETLKKRVSGYKHKTWEITNDEARKILDLVNKDQGKEILYNNLGNSKMYSVSFSGNEYHSCLSWAETKLEEALSKDVIQAPRDWLDIIVKVPSRHVDQLRRSNSQEIDGKTSGGCRII